MGYFEKYDFIEQDKSAKSLSFFCKSDIVNIPKDIIDELKTISLHERRTARISMHSNPQNEFHNMIIAHHKNEYVRPHKHLSKAETYHIIDGSMKIFVFDENGKVLNFAILDENNNFLYRFEKQYFHCFVPLSDTVLFHESKIGPFIREGDSIWAPFAPDGSIIQEVDIFVERLLGYK